MKKLLRSLLEWGFFVFGLVVVVSFLVQDLPEAKPSVQTLRFTHELCEYTAGINSRKWEATPYIIDSYKPVGARKDAMVYMHFLGDRQQGALYDPQACTSESAGDGLTARGLRIRYQKVQCPAEAATPYSAPPGRYRLFGAIEGQQVSLGAGLYTDKKELLDTHRAQLEAVLETFRPLSCEADLIAGRRTRR